MIPCYVKRADAASMANEAAMLATILERCGPIVLPYFRVDDRTISIIEYPSNLSNAVRFGLIDPCGSVVDYVIERVRAICASFYAAGIMHYDLHTSNIVLKWLGADTTCMPDVRAIDVTLAYDYVRPNLNTAHVRVFPQMDASYDWFFFCYSLMQVYKHLNVPLPAAILLQEAEVLAYKDRMQAAGHEWSRIDAAKIDSQG